MSNTIFQEISSGTLKAEQIPVGSDDWDEIIEFALTFQGYDYWGSFEECARIANARETENLTKARTCLFFEQRRWRHFEEIPTGEDLRWIQGIIMKIFQFVEEVRTMPEFIQELDANKLSQLAKSKQCFVPTDLLYQRILRILQTIWREKQGYPIGPWSSDKPEIELGSSLQINEENPEDWNFITKETAQIARAEMASAKKTGKVIKPDRMFGNLLSSQPLCFNLFGELKMERNRDLLGAVVSDMLSFPVQITDIEFEHSPGRKNPLYTADNTAFDTYIAFEYEEGKRGFLGIEVKYHENLNDRPAKPRDRYFEIANESGAFDDPKNYRFLQKPLNQLWRNHLLVLAHKDFDRFDKGIFILLYPRINEKCVAVANDYRTLLKDDSTFQDWTLDQFVQTLSQRSKAQWIRDFQDRYLDYEKVREALS